MGGRSAASEVALRERVEGHADHLLGPLAHLDEDVHERRVGVCIGDELGELGDRDAAVGAALEQQVDVQHREQQAQVARHRALQCEQRLDRAFDREEQLVDLVVEGDHLVGELDVALLERPDRSADGRDDALTLLLKLCFEPVERLVDRHRGHGTRDICLLPRVRHHFVTTPQQPRIPPPCGRVVPWPRTPKEERNPCRRSAL